MMPVTGSPLLRLLRSKRLPKDRLRWLALYDEHVVQWLCGLRQRRQKPSHPRLFEDVAKTICTINAHWRNTKRMVENLCRVRRVVPRGRRSVC